MGRTVKESLEAKRKRLLFRSRHRGSRELDILLGRFAATHLARLDADQLDRYEAVLANDDPEIFAWVSGREPVPAALDTDVMRLLKVLNNSA